MNRIVFAALMGLTLAIGLTVASMAWRMTSFDEPLPSLGTADPAVGYAFYDGIDQVLSGNSPDALKQSVADGFVDHGSGDDERQSADQLVDELIAFRQSFPGTRLVVNGVEAAAGTLVVSIAPMQPAGATIAGLPLTMEPFAGGYEVLRVRNGEVSERWSGGLPDIQAQSFDDAAFTMGATFGGSIRLDRIVLPDAGVVTLQNQGESIVIVESGTARIHLRWSDESDAPHSDVLTVNAGEANRQPPGSTIELASNGTDTAQVLRYSMQRVMVAAPTPPTITGGASIELLWMSNLSAPVSGKWNVSIGQMHLPAGADSTLGMPKGSQLLVCSDDGSAVLSTNKGEVFELDKQFWPSSLGSAGSIESGKAASVEGGESLDLRSESGAIVWILAITPEDVMATPEAVASPSAE